MLRTTLVLLVLIAAVPAAAEEMITVNKTPIREKPDLKADVLGEIPPNVKITPSERQDFWFRVTYKAGDKTIEGWVYQFDVDTLMGRSKGQLLAENKRLYDELVELREKVKGQDAELKTGKAQLAETTAERESLRAAQTAAQEQIKQLTKQTDSLVKAQDAELKAGNAQLAKTTAEREDLRAALMAAQEQIKQMTEQMDLLKKKAP